MKETQVACGTPSSRAADCPPSATEISRHTCLPAGIGDLIRSRRSTLHGATQHCKDCATAMSVMNSIKAEGRHAKDACPVTSILDELSGPEQADDCLASAISYQTEHWRNILCCLVVLRAFAGLPPQCFTQQSWWQPPPASSSRPAQRPSRCRGGRRGLRFSPCCPAWASQRCCCSRAPSGGAWGCCRMPAAGCTTSAHQGTIRWMQMFGLLASRQPVPQEFVRSLLPSHAVSCRLWHLGKALDGEGTQRQRSGDEPAAEQEQARRADGRGDAGASGRGEYGGAAGQRRQTYHVVMTSGGERCAPERRRKRRLLLQSPGAVLGLPQYAFLSQNVPRFAVLAQSCEARPWSPGCPCCHR